MHTIPIDFDSYEYSESLKIRHEVFIIGQKIPEKVEIDEFETTALYFLTFFNTTPAGTGRLRVCGDKIKFERIATLEKFRGKGVGKHMMKTMLNYAREKYPALIPYMHSQVYAVGFYEKLGWVKSGGEFIEAGIPHQAMVFPT